MAPILVALGAAWFLREPITPRNIVCALVALCGLVVLLHPRAGGTAPPGSTLRSTLGALYAAASAVFYASTVLQAKSLSRRFRPTELMGYHALVAALLIAAVVPVTSYRSAGLLPVSTVAVGALVCGTLGGLLWLRGLRGLPAAAASTLTLVEPVVAVALSFLFFGESLSLVRLFGGLIVLLATAFALACPSRAPVAPETAFR